MGLTIAILIIAIYSTALILIFFYQPCSIEPFGKLFGQQETK